MCLNTAKPTIDVMPRDGSDDVHIGKRYIISGLLLQRRVRVQDYELYVTAGNIYDTLVSEGFIKLAMKIPTSLYVTSVPMVQKLRQFTFCKKRDVTGHAMYNTVAGPRILMVTAPRRRAGHLFDVHRIVDQGIEVAASLGKARMKRLWGPRNNPVFKAPAHPYGKV